MKKMKALFMSLSVFAVLAAGCSTEKAPAADNSSAQPAGEQKAKKKIALVLPEKIGVNPFFQQMDEGVKKAGKDFGVDVKTIESTDQAAIEQNLRAVVAENYDLIITSSFESEDALKKKLLPKIRTSLSPSSIRRLICLTCATLCSVSRKRLTWLVRQRVSLPKQTQSVSLWQWTSRT
ncbi:UNVERIFIED_CONTAM: spermidine/putrescine-binding protein [Brevibacillus sp. OAP136]